LAELQEHWRFLEDALHAYSRSPLSIRKAMLVVALADAMVDRLFAAADNPEDLLAFRADVSAENGALSLVMELAAHRLRGPRFTVMERQIALEQYGELPLEDFMVSLYNNHSVQRLMVVGLPTEMDAEAVLQQAVAELRSLAQVS
jgi:hypothetical protein